MHNVDYRLQNALTCSCEAFHQSVGQLARSYETHTHALYKIESKKDHQHGLLQFIKKQLVFIAVE